MVIYENNFNRIGVRDFYFNTRYAIVAAKNKRIGPSMLDFMYQLNIVNFIKRNSSSVTEK